MSTQGKNKDALILGGGLSAAYISSACHDVGVTFDIKTIKKSPRTFGAIWLRWLPDRISDKYKQHAIHIIPIGTEEDYLKKQWGKSDFYSSFPKESYVTSGYDPNKVLNDLWTTDAYHIVSTLTDAKIAEIAKNYGVVFMTFPTQECISNSSNLEFNTPCAVWDLTQVPIGEYIPAGNMVFYIGNDRDVVVRHSRLFGKVYVEYIHSHIPNVDTLGEHGKIYWFTDLHPKTPVWNEERVPASNVYLVGRYAQRSRKVLAHEAYQRALNILEKTL